MGLGKGETLLPSSVMRAALLAHLIDPQHVVHGDHGAIDVGKFTLQLLVAGVDDERRVVVPHEVGDLDEAEQLTLAHFLT